MKNTARNVIRHIQSQGYKAYWVGGCVRDMLLHKKPQDYDIVTDASPEVIEKLFEKTYDIGKKFGIIHIHEKGHEFEIATFRSDSGYSDGRRPDAILFSNPEQDAKRRDFTINGIFYDPIEKQYHDFIKGISDLRRGLLRFIGNPDQRIKEDHLRVLRAIRFKNRFNLTYEKDTKKALKKHGSLIINVSGERIRDELNKIIVHKDRYKAFQDLDKLKLGQKILPEVWATKNIPQSRDYHSEGDVFDHTLLVLKNLRPHLPTHTYWAALLHDIGKTETIQYQGKRIRYPDHQYVSCTLGETLLKRLSFSKKDQKNILWIIKHHHIFDNWDDMKESTRLHYYDHPLFLDLLEVHRADIFGSKPLSYQTRDQLRQKILHIQAGYYDAHTEKKTPSHNTDLLSGNEIMKLLNIESGSKVGEIKDQLREEQLHQNITNKKEAKAWLKKNIQN